MKKTMMFLGSMDHTPSEQLGDLSQWHTTVLVVSEGGEHWGLADEIADKMRLQGRTLKKWARNAKGRYRTEFETVLTERLSAYPVHIRAVSAQGLTMIRQSQPLLQQMQVAGLVRPLCRNGKAYLQFGPFRRVGAEPEPFELPETQAIPVIFIAGFLLRAHHSIAQQVAEDSPGLDWIDWQLMPNKFPRGIDGPMAILLNAILSLASDTGIVQGSIRMMTLINSNQDHGSTLADNIAGLLAGKLRSPDRRLRQPPIRRLGSSMLWDIWNSADASRIGC